jgi:drug/metabolite transporter (DMT)-like permease
MPVLALPYGPLLIAGACLSWAIDNNVTRKISSGDPVQIAAIKGLCAGLLLLIIGVSVHGKFVSPQNIIFAALLGIICYGLSLVFFVLGLRNLGAARTAAYFSLAPFAGAFASFILLGEKISFLFVIAATFMTIGIYLHISERHQHEHHHDELAHQHKHAHDEHHRHEHDNIEIIDESHSHWHKHQAMIHSHPHYPDIHHRHAHDGEHDN